VPVSGFLPHTTRLIPTDINFVDLHWSRRKHG
jgi:hypothetical protein